MLLSPPLGHCPRGRLESQPLQEGTSPVGAGVGPREKDEDPAREASGADARRKVWALLGGAANSTARFDSILE